jgi:hypothetical protein
MIVYDLKCPNEHKFEGWFRDSATYDAQRKARKVDCPVCGSTKIDKAPMAPRLGKGVGDGERAEKRARALARKILSDVKKLKEHVETNCDYVGDKFAEEARKIHYGEKEARGIYGEATDAETKELADEDIKFAHIPWPSKRKEN